MYFRFNCFDVLIQHTCRLYTRYARMKRQRPLNKNKISNRRPLRLDWLVFSSYYNEKSRAGLLLVYWESTVLNFEKVNCNFYSNSGNYVLLLTSDTWHYLYVDGHVCYTTMMIDCEGNFPSVEKSCVCSRRRQLNYGTCLILYATKTALFILVVCLYSVIYAYGIIALSSYIW